MPQVNLDTPSVSSRPSHTRKPPTSSELSPDNWFVAARSTRVSQTPLTRTVLGRQIVLFRTASGRVVAMEDRCPHKNAALSLGRVRGESLRYGPFPVPCKALDTMGES